MMISIGHKEDCLDRVAAMIEQELKFYQCADYLDGDDEPNLPIVSPLHVVFQCAGLVTDVRSSPSSDESDSIPTPSSSRVRPRLNKHTKSPCSSMTDLHSLMAATDNCHRSSITSTTRHRLELDFMSSWRHEMLDWANVVTFTYNVARETIPVAFSILDRYLAREVASHDEPINREEFQLYAMVSMYIAIKILVPFRKLAVETLIDMSRGFYSRLEIEETEQEMLMALGWHVNPPIVMEYCRYFIQLLFTGDDDEQQTLLSGVVEETCSYIAEMALDDTYFISKPKSMIALSIMLVATQRHSVSPIQTQGLIKILSGLINIQSPEFDAILRRMEILC